MTDPQRCEPPNLVVKGCTVHNTVTLDLALVRALVNALAPFANAGSIFALTDNDLGTARAALARAKDAGL